MQRFDQITDEVEAVFVSMSLTLGPPREAYGVWAVTADFLEAALGHPRDTLSMTEIDEWIEAYSIWYAKEERASKEPQL